MTPEFLERLGRIASDVLNNDRVEVTAEGEDYYVFEAVAEDGTRSRFPAAWITRTATDGQIKEKLARDFLEAAHPDAAPGDLSVPNLETEGKFR
ncbi:MAG: hypothetical protein ABJC09_07365 [Terriglobia bacterium]